MQAYDAATAQGPELSVTSFVLDDNTVRGPIMCIAGRLQSAPPKCGGPGIAGLDWADVDDVTELAGQRYGDFSLTGTWDGDKQVLTLTRAPVPAAPVASLRPGGVPDGPVPDPETLASIMSDYENKVGTRNGLVHAGNVEGHPIVIVMYDDGTLQAQADRQYGNGVVEITSALQPVG